MYNFITNPENGKKYKMNSVEGKIILKKYIMTYNVGGSSETFEEIGKKVLKSHSPSQINFLLNRNIETIRKVASDDDLRRLESLGINLDIPKNKLEFGQYGGFNILKLLGRVWVAVTVATSGIYVAQDSKGRFFRCRQDKCAFDESGDELWDGEAGDVLGDESGIWDGETGDESGDESLDGETGVATAGVAGATAGVAVATGVAGATAGVAGATAGVAGDGDSIDCTPESLWMKNLDSQSKILLNLYKKSNNKKNVGMARAILKNIIKSHNYCSRKEERYEKRYKKINSEKIKPLRERFMIWKDHPTRTQKFSQAISDRRVLDSDVARDISDSRYISCCDGQTKIVKAHGAMTPIPFFIPEGVNVITLTVLGQSILRSSEIDKSLNHLYNSGRTLFKNNDTSTEKTRTATDMEQLWNSQAIASGKDYRFYFKNHVGPQKINNMTLCFTGVGCNEDTCSIDCYNEGHLTKSSCDPRKRGMDSLTLEELIQREGSGTYIIRSCRYLSGSLPEASVKFMRQISS